MPKDKFSKVRELSSKTTSVPSGCEVTSWILPKGYFVQSLPWCQRTVFLRPESYPLWQPLSPWDRRPLLHFWPTDTVVKKDSFFWGQRVILSTTSVPLEQKATTQILTKGYCGAQGQFFRGQRVTLSDKLCPLRTWGHISYLNLNKGYCDAEGQIF